MPNVGEPAPDFTLQDAAGGEVRLSDYRGRKVVLYFYPKDDTPGCTQEACDFRDAHAQFEAVGAVILGISPDSVASHRRFRDKHGLPFRLLADPECRVISAYGAWKERERNGQKSMGVERATFVIDAQGRVETVERGVKVQGHAAAMLARASQP